MNIQAVYCQNRRDPTSQCIQIDLSSVSNQEIQKIQNTIVNISREYKGVFVFKRNNLIYKTEILAPKVNKKKANLLLLFGNPAVHSIADGVFFSYQKKSNGGKKEHRFWTALRECKILEFDRNLENPTPENFKRKRRYLVNRDYESKFNIFLLTYFSFPTPASGKYSGVTGIREILGKDIFEQMRCFDYRRFQQFVSSNNIKHVICFQKTDVLKEIIGKTNGVEINRMLEMPVFNLGKDLKDVTFYLTSPTRSLHTPKGKGTLQSVISLIPLPAN